MKLHSMFTPFTGLQFYLMGLATGALAMLIWLVLLTQRLDAKISTAQAQQTTQTQH